MKSLVFNIELFLLGIQDIFVGNLNMLKIY